MLIFFYICKPNVTYYISVLPNIYEMAKDPVCNMMVDEKKTQHISEVNGRKIYLCSGACKTQFDQNPSKYGY